MKIFTKGFTKGFLAATILGIGAIGTGVFLSANANDYIPSYSDYQEQVDVDEVVSYEDEVASYDETYDISTENTISDVIEVIVEENTWEIRDKNGNLIDSGTVDSESIYGAMFGSITFIDEDGIGEIEHYFNFLETEADWEAWIEENDIDSDFPVFIVDDVTVEVIADGETSEVIVDSETGEIIIDGENSGTVISDENSRIIINNASDEITEDTTIY